MVSINLHPEGATQTAIVEFESADEAQYAQHLQVKPFDGENITIEAGLGTILWVTNYPDDADEAYMRNLFQEVRSSTSYPRPQAAPTKIGFL